MSDTYCKNRKSIPYGLHFGFPIIIGNRKPYCKWMRDIQKPDESISIVIFVDVEQRNYPIEDIGWM